MKIIQAEAEDLFKIKDFAKKVGVDWLDIDDATRFFILNKGQIAASLGFTLIGDCAVLRALIIDPEKCGLGEAMHLLQKVCQKAQELGAKAVYLATTVPAYIFQLTGFTQIEPKDLPEALRNHPPFSKQAEKRHATMMMKYLKEENWHG
jgi:N-acetylglutamate synthase-like GNAT family acetyltransferase